MSELEKRLKLADKIRDSFKNYARNCGPVYGYFDPADYDRMEHALRLSAKFPDREAWQPIETAGDDNMILLVCNPDEGTLPVLAWKIETTWYEYGIYGKPLRPPPKYWMKCPTMPRISNHEQEVD